MRLHDSAKLKTMTILKIGENLLREYQTKSPATILAARDFESVCKVL